MEKKQVIHTPIGMNRDISISKVDSSKYAYENKNIRITNNKEGSYMTICNEQGTREYSIKHSTGEVSPYIYGAILGVAEFSDCFILFMTNTYGDPDEGEKADLISKCYIEKQGTKDVVVVDDLYIGDLNFNVNNPIETLCFLENGNKKVYWVDGLNSPRVINVDNYNKFENIYDFVPKLELNEEVTIEKSNTGGTFHSGIIQYAFSYYRYLGQESNLFYVSPLYYISNAEGGGNAEELFNNSFNISIDNIDLHFDFVRIYSIHRTSLNAIPEAKVVTDLSIKNLSSVYYTDTGSSGYYIDPTQLLYVGGKEFSAGAISSKDGTLFLGNLEIKNNIVPKEIDTLCKKVSVCFKTRDDRYVLNEACSGYYPYKNQLSNNSQQIKTFKYLEYYRLGLQVQDSKGIWSNPIFVGDVQNKTPISSTLKSDKSYLPYAEGTLESDLINKLIDIGYKRVRPVVVYPSDGDRSCLCQGVLCPTVFSEEDRNTNSPFSQASWFFRPNAPFTINIKDANEKDEIYTRGYRGYRLYISFEDSQNFSVGDKMYLNSSDFGTYTVDYIGSCLDYIDRETVELYYIEVHTNNLSYNKDYPKFNLDNIKIIKKEEDSITSTYDVYNLEIFWVDNYKYFKNNVATSGNLIYSKTGVTTNTADFIRYDNGNIGAMYDIYDKGSFVEFRHLHKLPDNDERNAEIQCNHDFYVDQSIITLHSPDIELDDYLGSYHFDDVKLRIVGAVPLTSFEGSIDISPKNPYWYSGSDSNTSTGLFKSKIKSSNYFSESLINSGESFFGYRGLISGPFWIDREINAETDALGNPDVKGFVVYPWHRNGSLNNAKNIEDNKDIYTPLKSKTIKNRRFSYNSIYFNTYNIWEAYIEGDSVRSGIKDAKIFDSSDNVAMKLKAPDNHNNSEFLYYGNVDKILTSTDYKVIQTYEKDVINRDPKYSKLFNSYYDVYNSISSRDPVSMQYKSTKHAVIVLNSSSEEYAIEEGKQDKKRIQQILPTLYDYRRDFDNKINLPINLSNIKLGQRFWENQKTSIKQDCLNIDFDLFKLEGPYVNLGHGWLWLGELYRDNVINRFGGTTESAIENNQWLPCGNSKVLTRNTNISINWDEGDTYYQRYDHIKTFPQSTDAQNSVVEIVSFMCESKVNLDSRYDKNRKTLDTILLPENFNKINPVYSQQNNFFNYRGNNYLYPAINKFPYTITWSKTKTSGEYIDTWTNAVIASTLDLDNIFGKISSIKQLNNELIVFQDTAISQLLYNERVQIATTAGVPIEIGNSGKVDGIRYLYNDIGCSNKWGTCTTKNGIYFFDGNSKSLYFLNRDKQIKDISGLGGFNTWFNSNIENAIWDPFNFKGCVLQYDSINEDVLVITKEDCLAYSEKLQTFTSFYDYNRVSNIIRYKDTEFLLRNEIEYPYITHLYGLHEGQYNYFFDEYKPFYTTIMVNEHPTIDKVFTNIEFRADSYIGDTVQHNLTFDTLETWNEYQYGSCNLVNNLGYPSNLKKKFRIWRANIPRDNSNGRDRMRNPWLYLKLGKTKFTNNKNDSSNSFKLQLHDIVVDYYK